MLRSFLFTLLLCVSAWENLSVQRNYLIKDHLVYHKLIITAKNDSPKPQDTYIFLSPFNEQIGHIQAPSLTVTEVDQGEYSLLLPQPVAAGEKKKIEVTLTVGHALKAMPSKTQMLEPNAVEFSFPLKHNSPYVTRNMEISISGFDRLLSYEPTFFTLHGNVLAAKIPQDDASVTATTTTTTTTTTLTSTPTGVVHFMHDSALNFVASAVRQVHVSHFGGISVVDDFEVKNEAASLQGEFTRIPFSVREQMAGKSPFKLDGYSQALGAIFSKYAYNIHYYDVIGNISSSVAKRSSNQKYIAAELSPRFPLIGGWRTEFSVSHVLPTQKAIGFDADSGKFTVTFPFNHPLVKYFTDELEFEVLLPEGAFDVEVSAPRRIDQIPISYRRDWLATPLVGGNTVLRFRATSPFVIPEKEALNYKLSISYRLSSFALVRPALLLVVYAAMLFGAVGLLARLTTGEALPESLPTTPSGAPTRGQATGISAPGGFVVVHPTRAESGIKKRK